MAFNHIKRKGIALTPRERYSIPVNLGLQLISMENQQQHVVLTAHDNEVLWQNFFWPHITDGTHLRQVGECKLFLSVINPQHD